MVLTRHAEVGTPFVSLSVLFSLSFKRKNINTRTITATDDNSEYECIRDNINLGGKRWYSAVLWRQLENCLKYCVWERVFEWFENCSVNNKNGTPLPTNDRRTPTLLVLKVILKGQCHKKIMVFYHLTSCFMNEQCASELILLRFDPPYISYIFLTAVLIAKNLFFWFAGHCFVTRAILECAT